MEHLNDRHSPALALRALHHLELRLRGVPSLRDRAPEVNAVRLAARSRSTPRRICRGAGVALGEALGDMPEGLGVCANVAVRRLEDLGDAAKVRDRAVVQRASVAGQLVALTRGVVEPRLREAGRERRAVGLAGARGVTVAGRGQHQQRAQGASYWLHGWSPSERNGTSPMSKASSSSRSHNTGIAVRSTR